MSRASAEDSVRSGLHWIAAHTGIPVVLVAAVLLVAGFRLFKWGAKFFIQVALMVVLLLVAVKLGWVRF